MKQSRPQLLWSASMCFPVYLCSWALCLWLFSALSLAYTVKMWCCSSYWGKWRARWIILVMKHATSNYDMMSFCCLPPTVQTCVTICQPPSPSRNPPSYDHPLVFLTGSVPICLPRYLIPCNHMMLSQRRVVRERDCYSVSAAKILGLTPSCCSPDRSPPPLRQLDSILFSKGAETPNNNNGAKGKRERTLQDHFVRSISAWILFLQFC